MFPSCSSCSRLFSFQSLLAHICLKWLFTRWWIKSRPVERWLYIGCLSSVQIDMQHDKDNENQWPTEIKLRTPTHHVAWIHQAKIQGWLLHVDKLPCNPIPGGRELLPSCPRPWAAGNCYLVQLIADTTLIRLPLGLELWKGGKFTWLSVTRLSLWSIQGGIGWLHLTW